MEKKWKTSPICNLCLSAPPPPLISLNRIYNKRKSLLSDLLSLSAPSSARSSSTRATPPTLLCSGTSWQRGVQTAIMKPSETQKLFLSFIKKLQFQRQRTSPIVARCCHLHGSWGELPRSFKKNCWRKIYLRDAIICWIMLEEKKSKHLNGKFGVSLSDATFSKSHLEPHKWEGGMCSLYQ